MRRAVSWAWCSKYCCDAWHAHAPVCTYDSRRTQCLQPVAMVLHLEHAQRLGALSDGQLLLLDADTMEGQPLPGIKVGQPHPRWTAPRHRT